MSMEVVSFIVIGVVLIVGLAIFMHATIKEIAGIIFDDDSTWARKRSIKSAERVLGAYRSLEGHRAAKRVNTLSLPDGSETTVTYADGEFIFGRGEK